MTLTNKQVMPLINEVGRLIDEIYNAGYQQGYEDGQEKRNDEQSEKQYLHDVGSV